MSNNYYATSGQLGADPSSQSATALFALGTHLLGSNNTEWVYVQAQTTISSVSWVAFNATYSAGMASAGDANAGLPIGLSNTVISASSYGWIAIRGNGLTGRFTGTGSLAQTSGELHLASSAAQTGLMMVGTVGTASNTVLGVYLASTASASASASGGLGVDGSNVALFNLVWPAVNPG